MTTALLGLPIFRAFNAAGLPLAGGLLYTYAAGTLTPQNTYSDSAGSTPNTNPVVLDSTGSATVRLDPALSYKFVLNDALGTLQWSEDNYQSLYLTQAQFNAYLGASTPYAQTAAEIAAGVTPTNFGYPPFDLRRYGGDPTGVSASDAAMTSAIAVAGTIGGMIYLSRGTWLFNNTYSFANKDSITLYGDGAPDAGSTAPTSIQYAGTASPFMDFSSSRGCQIKQCQIIFTNASFTGTLIKPGNDGTHGDSFFFAMTDVHIGGATGTGCTHVDTNKGNNIQFTRVHFTYGNPAVSGQAQGGASYSNRVTFNQCEFTNARQTPVKYPGQTWSFYGCTFENKLDTTAGAVFTDTSTPVAGFFMSGCWFGDSSSGTGAWLTLTGNGISLQGNRFTSVGINSTGISINGVNGFKVNGNTFISLTNAFSWDTGTNVGCDTSCNFYSSVTNVHGGTLSLAPLYLQYNPSSPMQGALTNISLFGNNGYEYSSNGVLRQWGKATVTTGTPLAITFATANKAFTTLWNVVCGIDSPTATTDTVTTSSSSATGFTISVAGTAGTSTVYWQAIGN